MKSATLRPAIIGILAWTLAGCSGGGGGSVTPPPTGNPAEIQSFASVQEVFDLSCSFSTCHSAVTRAGGLVLDHEEISLTNLVGVDAFHPEARAQGLQRVVPGDPDNSYLIRKLRGDGPGDTMPQGSRPLSEDAIAMIEEWIARGAQASTLECASSEVVCDGNPLPEGDYSWQPEPALEAPPPGEGIQLYTPARDIEPGDEWETCYAFRVDASNMPTANLRRQVYRMHEGSHHLLVYMYFGPNKDDFAEGFYPCFAGQCENEGDCPEDTPFAQYPIGGTQVAGTRYVVEYPQGIGLPFIGNDVVIIANLHYTNPFFPRQRIYGESWINFEFYQPGEMKAVLDAVFAINSRDLIVEPYETKTISRLWHPISFLNREPVDAAIFQLFGHMHKRGISFTIDLVTDTEDVQIYNATSWDHAPVQDYEPPYLRVNQDEALRWSCTHRNGIEGDPSYPPKRCRAGCRVCGWDETKQKCVFTRDGSDREYSDGEPMPLAWGELADDDMCNMFGYFIRVPDLANLP